VGDGIIRPGQVYRSCAPVRGEPKERYIRIKVIGYPIHTVGLYGYGKVEIVTLLDNGKEVRHRAIECSELHDSPYTLTGAERRTGYVLETDE
jgi:hypothetical protein